MTPYFLALGSLAVIAALLTILSRSAIRAAVFLLFHIVSLAGLFVALRAHFLSAIQLMVYAGAVVVLFVFVIMLIGPTEEPPPEGRGVVARTVGASFMAIVTAALLFAVGTLQAPAGVEPDDAYGRIQTIGRLLFTDALAPFELVGILLLVGVLGAIAVAKGRSPEESAAIAEQRRRKIIADRPLVEPPKQ